MNNMLYLKLARTNIKANGKTYLPYVITCICTIMMFYIMHALSINEGLNGVSGSDSLKMILYFGTIVIGIFSAIFLFYINSFLIKRRKKEIGLYNILGLGKKHISIVLLYENVFISLISLVFGLMGGVILNKLMFLVLLKILDFAVPFGFSVSIPSMEITLLVFIGIFAATLISNLFQIHMAKPIELLRGGEHGEKEPKTKWLMTIIGIIALGIGYAMALTVKSPLSALSLFFVAVILVMVGTYCLFTAGSIAILKLLRKNKQFYYKTRNFTSISGMLYRMKQNAVGLANICILSTAVLVMISTTVSLYIGMEDGLRARFPKDVMMNASGISENQTLKLNEIVDLATKETKINNRVSYSSEAFMAKRTEDAFLLRKAKDAFSSDSCLLMTMSLSDYNRIEGKNVSLKDDELLIFSTVKNYGKNIMTIQDKSFKVKEELSSIAITNKNPLDILGTYILILKDVEAVRTINAAVPGTKSSVPSYKVDFDVTGTDKEIISLTDKLRQEFSKEIPIPVSLESAAGSKESFFAVYGGLFFIGIFLGALFLMATVLIIYYKQISEGYDDKERFNIMQKVGMSKAEIKKSINRQILMVFFLPLVFAVIHITFAFPMIAKLLAVLNLINVPLLRLCTVVTILVFAVIYTVVYFLTARVYLRIVDGEA
ncbi:MAG TPA: ABC transporter permease [Desulfosporosinus sp.]|nr:ABC transporter permease [Desulfosporosinus sp.]